jgi:hypothetical protein
MTEAEIMDRVILNEEAHQAIYQWWVGICFGLIALAHFGRIKRPGFAGDLANHSAMLLAC